MTLEDAIKIASERRLRIQFDADEVSESRGNGILLADVDGNPVRALIALIEAVIES